MTTKRLSADQLSQFRNHASQYPVGDTAQLLNHIDWQRERFKYIEGILANLSAHSRADDYWLQEIQKVLAEGGE